MERFITSFLFVLLLLSSARARPISFLPTTRQESNLHTTPSSNPTVLSPESSLDAEDGCRDSNSEGCLIRRFLVAHTDYIYTQNTVGP